MYAGLTLLEGIYTQQHLTGAVSQDHILLTTVGL